MTATAPADAAADWDLARRVAVKVAGRDPLEDSYLAASLGPDFADATTRADVLVRDDTGLQPTVSATCAVIDRAGWIDTNLSGFQRLLAPLSDKLAEAAPGLVKRGGRAVVGAELGVLLGFLGRRVLGQYDLFIPEDGQGQVFYVGPNILNIEKRFGFPPKPFRLWVAIHEVTHRAQFTGVPWLRDYFLSLVDETLSSIDPDPRRIVDGLLRAVDALRRGEDPLADGGIVGLFATEAQRATLQKIQAMMSVLEGHGNVVMDRLGAEHVQDQSRMSAALKARRHAGGPQRLLYRLTGIEMKVQQYELGEQFITEVERQGGRRALDPVWRGPENLPTMDEIRKPTLWLARVA